MTRTKGEGGYLAGEDGTRVRPMGRALILAALLSFPSGRSVAQSPPPDSAWADLAQHLNHQSRIRVTLEGGQPAPIVLLGPRLVGSTIQFDRYGPGAWTFDTTTRAHAIPIQEIRRIQVRGGAWDKGAIVGFLAGAMAIGAVNLAGKYQIDRGETLWFELLFGSAGAVAGAPIGGLFGEWHTVYPAPTP